MKLLFQEFLLLPLLFAEVQIQGMYLYRDIYPYEILPQMRRASWREVRARKEALRTKTQEFAKEIKAGKIPKGLQEISLDDLKAILTEQVELWEKENYHPSLLEMALTVENVPAVTALAQAGQRVGINCLDILDIDGYPFLHKLIMGHYEKRYELMRAMLQGGATPNIICYDQWEKTPLHVATLRNETDAMLVLLEFKADIDKEDAWGATPLYYSAGDDTRSAALQLLIDYKATVDSNDKFGMTPLHGAAFHECELAIQTLIDHNADVRCLTKNKRTPLHLAAGNLKLNAVKILLRCVDKTLQDANGETALDLAREAEPDPRFTLSNDKENVINLLTGD